MKKQLLAMACSVACAAPAFAADAEIDHSGEFRARYNYANQADFTEDQGSGSFWEQRFLVGVNYRANEKFAAYLELLQQSVWGNDIGATPAENPGRFDGNNTENQVLAYQAYGSWMIADGLMAKFGRMVVEDGNGLVLGQDDWQQVPYSWDGGSLAYDADFASLNLTGLKLSDRGFDFDSNGTDDVKTDTEWNVYILSADIKNLPDVIKDVHIHAIQSSYQNGAAGTATTGADSLRLGLTLGGVVSLVDYSVSYETHSGETRVSGTGSDTDGNMIDAEVGFNFESFMNSRAYVRYHVDSGTSGSDNETYDSFFYNTHANAGLLDILAFGNLTWMSLGYELKPSDSLQLGLHYHMFTKTEKDDNYYVVDTSSINGRTGVTSTGEDDLGSEIDLVATHKYDEDFQIQAILGFFQPGDVFGSDAEDRYDLVVTGTWMF